MIKKTEDSKISVVIADDNKELRSILVDCLSACEDMTVVGAAKDGLETIEMIKALKPEVIILDIIMPGLDGIGVLEMIKSLGLQRDPLIIMVSGLGVDKYIQQTLSLGADYYLIKPFNVSILITRIRELYREKHGVKKKPASVTADDDTGTAAAGLETAVTSLINNLGILPHVSGFPYLREAVMTFAMSSKPPVPITKVLYPSISRKFNSTADKVARAIRNAIENGWLRGEREHWAKVFGRESGKPTNLEFITILSDTAKRNHYLKK